MAKVADGIRYAERVVAGEIVAGEFVRLACQRFLDDLKYGEERGIYFSEPRAQHILNFYKFVPHVKGALAGQPIELMDWHVFILINIFGFVIPLVNEETGEVVMRSDGSGRPVMVRRFRTAYNEVARKNAKSTLSSGIGLYMTGADGEGGAEVYSAATTRDQARIVFEDAKNMVRKARSTLGRLFDFNKLAIYQEQSASKFEPLSSDANNLDGLNIHCAIIDELHAHKTRDVWDVLETATGARLQSLLFGITTAGFNGKLTADKVVPALISQLGALRDEYAAMPDTVSSSATKVENAFMAWVGGANEASGVTKTLSGVLNGLAGNIDTVATAAGALVAVGVARYFGNMASSAGSATAGLITAARNEVALAEAQLRGTQIATARARAAVYRAQQAVVAARGTERQAAAEAKLTAAQASLTRNIAARTAAQTTLNTVTSVGSRLLSGALGLVGGVPGLVMLGATAWYTMYQNQEQARESARQYAATIDEIRQKTSAMSLPEASDNEEKTRQALDEQNRLIDEQKSKIKSLQEKIAGYQYVLANPGWTTDNGFMINHMTSVKTVTEGLAEATNQLAVEQSRLTQMQGKAQSIQDVLAGLEERRVALIRQQAAEQNKAYQSLLIMNGQHTEFNRLLGLGNELLQQRQGLVNVPLRLPQATLDDKQQTALNNSERELALSRLKGEARERARLGYAADDLGFVGEAYQTARQNYINNSLDAWRNNQANKPKAHKKTEAEKTEDIYKRLIKQQKEQIALAGQNTELAKMKYQVSQGELSTLSEAQKKTLLQNAALIDQKKIREQLAAYESSLADSNASTRTRHWSACRWTRSSSAASR